MKLDMISVIALPLVGLLFPLLLAKVSYAQSTSTIPTQLSVERLTVDDGMPSNEVRKVYKDRIGFMWFLTSRGLVKYNAHDCRIYQNQSRNSNSLSNDELFDIREDEDGIFWIASKEGLNRLDTHAESFQRFSKNPNHPTGYFEDFITSLLKDRKGNFWVGTALGGLYLFDPKTVSFTSYRHDPANPHSIACNQINKLAEDPFGKIWVGTTGGNSLDRFDPETGIAEHLGIVYPNEGHPNIMALHVDSSGRLWYGSWGYGLYCYNPADGTYRNYRNDPTNAYSIPSNIVHCVVEDKEEGWFWIGTRNGGLCIFDPQTEQFHSVKLILKTDPNAIVDTVLDIYWDPQGILWLGTLDDGVCRYDSNREQILYIKNNPKDSNSLNENRVYALCTDPDGSIWIGTDGGGLNRYDPETNRFTHYLGDSGDLSRLDSITVISLYNDRQGNLWIGSWGSDNAPLCRYDRGEKTFCRFPNEMTHPTGFHGSVVRSICEDYTGAIWISSESYGVVVFDPQTETFRSYEAGQHGLLITSFQRLFEDHTRRLWIATEQGLQYYDRENDRFLTYTPDSQNSVSFPNNNFTTLFEDSRKCLWVGTDQGLYKLNPDRTIVNRYSMDEGLANNVVKAIEEDDSGYLWISLDNGKISRFDPSSRRVINFDKSDGLQSLSFSSNCSTKGKQGELYFGGLNGLNCIQPDQIVQNHYVPPVVITSFEVLGNPYLFQQSLAKHNKIVLDYFQNFLSFEFAALNFTRSHKNQYKYRLLPLEENWNDAGSRRFAQYTSLEPGEYTLQVIGSNNDSVWNTEGVSIPIYINSPIWKTWWFQLSGVGLIAVFILFRYLELRKQKRYLEAEVRRQTKELQEANSILEKISLQDGLTNVSNRRCFDERIQEEWARAFRNKTYLSLLFIDVDFFKKYNDYYGHIAGDECLKQVARILRQNVKRSGDLVARYGGEEFVLLLIDVNPDNAFQFAERLCSQVRELAIPHLTSEIFPVVTISIGVASVIPTTEWSIASLVQAADRGVYLAKSEGRNRVTAFDPIHLPKT